MNLILEYAGVILIPHKRKEEKSVFTVDMNQFPHKDRQKPISSFVQAAQLYYF